VKDELISASTQRQQFSGNKRNPNLRASSALTLTLMTSRSWNGWAEVGQDECVLDKNQLANLVSLKALIRDQII
jgi:hypothetical protein